MLWEVDVFVAALERDLIGAADFAAKLPRSIPVLGELTAL